MMKRFIFLFILGGFLSGCSILPQGLQVADESTLSLFADARENPESVQGKPARWGGVIAKVVNNANNTMLEIVSFQLASSSKPIKAQQTQGRFRIYAPGLLDPMIYKEGLSITVLGSIAAAEQGKIGEHEYLYPVLTASYLHLWKDIQKVDVRISHYPYWYSPSYWRYNPSYYNRNYQRNYNRTLVIKESPKQKASIKNSAKN